METRSFDDDKISVLTLGTAQFGMPYGIANRRGQPPYGDILAIVKAAIEGGVTCFDTAAAYGCSEQMLGQAFDELGVAERMVVVTKVRPLTADELADSVVAGRAIEESVAESRRRLGIECLPVVLFHRVADAVHLPVLEALQRRGWLRHIGVSCDHRPALALELAKQPGVTAVQLPANLIDQRHQRWGVFELALKNHRAVFVRSIFLQGLLQMPESGVSEALGEVVPVRRQLAAIAHAAGVTLGELAIRYMLAQRGVTSLLTGVETVAQVRSNLAMVQRGPLDGELVEAVNAVVPNLPERVVTPSMWNAGENTP